jgi:DNA-binding MarR family transcriptional regulator
MHNANRIIDELIRITERADAFRHGREDFFLGIGLAEMHCIHWIGMLNDPNVTKIADQMQMTRGAISKIARKLLSKDLIASYKKPTNNKEIYYQLTENGRRLFDEHKKCHTQVRQEKLTLLQSFSEAEQDSILRFLNAINGQLDRKLTGKPSFSGRDAEE